LITSDGGAVRELFGLENSPIRWTVLGLIDPTEPDEEAIS
jgi:microcompartment protein CcmK/EutM